jgi:uncharacterized protein (DUF1330 family)
VLDYDFARALTGILDLLTGTRGEAMPAYLVVEVTINDPATYERYKTMAPPTIAQYGGRYLARGGHTEVLEGGWSPTRLVILEFASVERARAWWNSPEYAAAKALRQSCTDTDMVLLEGLPTGQRS